MRCLVFRRLFSLIIIQSILLSIMSPSVLADEVASKESSANTSIGTGIANIANTSVNYLNSTVDRVDDFQNGRAGMRKWAARPISKFVFEKMGEPGFYLSKYMSYRKMVNTPTCTTSQKLNYYATMITFFGDIATHVYSWKSGKDLKKEYGSQMSLIKGYSDKIASGEVVESSQKPSKDIQILAYDYMIKVEEINLKRLNLLRMIKYPALAMYAVAQILNIAEELAETSSAGAYTVKMNACHAANEPKRAVAEAKTEAQTNAGQSTPAEAKKDDTPWYLKPFMWIKSAGETVRGWGKAVDEKIKPAKEFRSEYGSNVSRGDKKLEDQYSYTDSSGNKVDGLSALNSASYAEQMITDSLLSMLSNKIDETNLSGMKKAVTKEATYLGVRYAVRSMIKANIATVDKFMRSAIGRTVVYAYNAYVLIQDFINTEKEIKIAKEKIKLYKNLRAEVTSTVYIPLSEKFLNKYVMESFRLLLGVAHANVEESSVERLPKFVLLDNGGKIEDVKKEIELSLKNLPENYQKDSLATISGSYGTMAGLDVLNGKKSISDLDQNLILADFNKNSLLVDQKYEQLEKKKLLDTKNFEAYEAKNLKEVETLVASVGGNLELFNKSVAKKEDVAKSFISNSSENKKEVENKKNEVVTFESSQKVENNKPVEEHKEAKFEMEFINNKEQNIWEIISNRYKLKFEVMP